MPQAAKHTTEAKNAASMRPAQLRRFAEDEVKGSAKSRELQ